MSRPIVLGVAALLLFALGVIAANTRIAQGIITVTAYEADVNKDTRVNSGDQGAVASKYGQTAPTATPVPPVLPRESVITIFSERNGPFDYELRYSASANNSTTPVPLPSFYRISLDGTFYQGASVMLEIVANSSGGNGYAAGPLCIDLVSDGAPVPGSSACFAAAPQAQSEVILQRSGAFQLALGEHTYQLRARAVSEGALDLSLHSARLIARYP